MAYTLQEKPYISRHQSLPASSRHWVEHTAFNQSSLDQVVPPRDQRGFQDISPQSGYVGPGHSQPALRRPQTLDDRWQNRSRNADPREVVRPQRESTDAYTGNHISTQQQTARPADVYPGDRMLPQRPLDAVPGMYTTGERSFHEINAASDRGGQRREMILDMHGVNDMSTLQMNVSPSITTIDNRFSQQSYRSAESTKAHSGAHGSFHTDKSFEVSTYQRSPEEQMMRSPSGLNHRQSQQTNRLSDLPDPYHSASLKMNTFLGAQAADQRYSQQMNSLYDAEMVEHRTKEVNRSCDVYSTVHKVPQNLNKMPDLSASQRTSQQTSPNVNVNNQRYSQEIERSTDLYNHRQSLHVNRSADAHSANHRQSQQLSRTFDKEDHGFPEQEISNARELTGLNEQVTQQTIRSTNVDVGQPEKGFGQGSYPESILRRSALNASDHRQLYRSPIIISYVENLDFGIYNFMNRFKMKELLSIVDTSTVETTVALNFRVQSKAQGDVIKEKILKLYKQTEDETRRQEFNMGVTGQWQHLKDLLDREDGVIYPINGKTVGLVCHQDNRLLTEKSWSSHANKVDDIEFAPVGYMIYGMVKLYLHVGDLTKMHVDIVVSAANSYLEPEGSHAQSIALAAGSDFHVFCRRIVADRGPVAVSEVVPTTAGKLPVKCVLHAIYPVNHKDQNRQEEDSLWLVRRTFDNVFTYVFQSAMETVAMPILGADDSGVPSERVAEMLYTSLLGSVEKYFFHEDNHLKEIHLIDTNPFVLRYLADLLNRGARAEGGRIVRQIAWNDVGEAVRSCSAERQHRLPPVRPQQGHHQAHSPGGTLNSESEFRSRGYLLHGRVKLILCICDITLINVDVIVNLTDERLTVSRQLTLAAGAGFQAALRTIMLSERSFPVGTVIPTVSGLLPCSTILHVTGPAWAEYGTPNQREQCIVDLQKAFDRVIEYACKNDIKTIAIPIASEILRIPDIYIANALYPSLVYHITGCYHSGTNLDIIYIVAQNPGLLNQFGRRFDDYIASVHSPQSPVSHLDRQRIDEAVSGLTCPLIPPKASLDHVNRDDSSSSSDDSNSDSSKDTRPKEGHATAKEVQTTASTQSGKHVSVYTRKTTCCSCFKPKRQSPSYEIGVEYRDERGHEQTNGRDEAPAPGHDVKQQQQLSDRHDDGGFGGYRTPSRHVSPSYRSSK